MSDSEEDGIETGEAALHEVAKPDGRLNWVLVGGNPTLLPLEGGGADSVDQMREELCTRRRVNVYGLIRLEFGTGKAMRFKWAFLHARQVGAPHKAATRPKMQEALARFATVTTMLELSKMPELTVDWVVERIRRHTTDENDFITVKNFREAVRWRDAEARRIARERRESEQALHQAVQTRDPNQIKLCIVDARRKKVARKVIQQAETWLQQILDYEAELKACLAQRDFTSLHGLIEKGKELGMANRPAAKEAMRTQEKLFFYEVSIEFEPGTVGPRRTFLWRMNPTVQLELQDAQERADVQFKLIPEGGEPLYGFHVVQNPRGIPPYCPGVVPGGPIVKEVPCGPKGFAAGSVGLVGGARYFCVSSPLDFLQEGSHARLLISSTKEMVVCPIPPTVWPFEETIQSAWSQAEKNAGGERGGTSWHRNPQFRVYLETLHEEEKVCIMAILSVSSTAVSRVSIHAVKNEYRLARSPHAAVIPDAHQVIAEPEPSYQHPCVGICFEVCRHELELASEQRTPPIFFVPSVGRPNCTGRFTLHLCSTSRLNVQRGGVSATAENGRGLAGRELRALTAARPGSPRVQGESASLQRSRLQMRSDRG